MPRKNKNIPNLLQKKLEIAKEVGISKTALYDWKKTRPKLYEIIMKHYGLEEDLEPDTKPKE